MIGIERVYGPQSAEILLGKLVKSIITSALPICCLVETYVNNTFGPGTCTLEHVIARWNLEEHLICATTNQRSNIKRAMYLYNLKTKLAWLPCSFHVIQLYINKGLERSLGAKMIMEKCQRISTFFRSSSLAMGVLNNERSKSKKKLIKLPTTNVTRCSSQYYMAARVLRVSEAITATYNSMSSGSKDEKAKAMELGRHILDEKGIRVLQEIITLLELVTKFTRWADEHDNPTISQIYFRVHTMLPALSTFETEEGRELWQSLDELIKKSWSLQNIPDAALISIFLNPAFASLDILQNTMVADDGNLFAKAKRLCNEALGIPEQQDANSMKPLQASNIHLLDMTSKFAVEMYAATVRPPLYTHDHFKDKPQDYWRSFGIENHITFGALANLARSYLCIQSASTESEHLFSDAGVFLSPFGTYLSDQNVCNIIFSHSSEKVRTLLDLQ